MESRACNGMRHTHWNDFLSTCAASSADAIVATVLDAFHFEVLHFFFWQGDMITVLKQDPSGWWQVCQCVVCVCACGCGTF